MINIFNTSFLFLLLSSFVSLGQAGVTPYEKVYLHLDKTYYTAGDTIWFKGYTVEGPAHKLSSLSGILNVDLINEQRTIIQSIKLAMVSGMTYGDVPLPDTISGGNYHIRAYTRLMQNAGPDYFFDRQVYVTGNAAKSIFTKAGYSYSGKQVNVTIHYLNNDGVPYAGKEVKYTVRQQAKTQMTGKGQTDEAGNISISFLNNDSLAKTASILTQLNIDNKTLISKEMVIPAQPGADVQFFPEGGYLLNGIASKIAFKAIGSDGLGKPIKGMIIDNQGNDVAPVNSVHLGMGSFMLAPEKGKTYSAKITFENGATGTIPLTPAKDDGYVLAIDNSDPVNIHVKVIAVNKTGEVRLTVQSGGEICYEAKGNMDRAILVADIPKSKLYSGIAKLTLFSASGEPLNERNVFIEQTGQINLSLNTLKESYNPREKVKAELSAVNGLGQPIIGNFSMSVINESGLPVDETAESTILSNLLLTSDLKGNIETPNYYFTNVTQKTREDLDLLMLTQGYGRFERKNVVGEKSPLAYQPEKELSISGRVMTVWHKPMANNKIFLISKTGSDFIDTVTNKEGYFNFDNLAFKDGTSFVIKTSTPNDKDNVTIEIDHSMPLVKENDILSTPREFERDSILTVYSKKREGLNGKMQQENVAGNKMLAEVKINRQRLPSEKEIALKKYTEYSSNLNGPGQADQVLTAEDLENYYGMSLTSALSGRLAGVEFRFDSTGSGLPYLRREPADVKPAPMEVVLDGQVVTYNSLSEVPLPSIASIEVLRTVNYRVTYGSRGGGGVLIVTTKHGGQDYLKGEKAPGIINITPKGYFIAHEFYLPKYTSNDQTTAPDFRTTIYWEPVLQTNREGKISFEYFNADVKGSYRVVVEGIDGDGNLARQVYRYKVE